MAKRDLIAKKLKLIEPLLKINKTHLNQLAMP